MFKELRIENFKGFASNYEIQLAPITLIYGSNSAGKSAILESLLLLSQSIRGANINSETTMEPFVFTGKHLDLGSFQNTVNGHNLSRAIKLGLTYSKPKEDNNEIESFDISVSWDHNLKRTVLDSCIYRVSTAPENTVIFKKTDSGNGNVSVKPVEDFAIRNIAEGVDEVVKRKFFKEDEVKPCALEVMLNSEYQNSSFLPGLKVTERADNLEKIPSDEAKAIVAKEFTHSDWRRRLDLRFGSTRRSLSRIRYIGPLRKSPVRFQVLREQLSNYVGISGDDVATILYRNPDSVLKINKYLSKLEIPYEILIKRMDSDNTGTLGELISIQLVDKRSNVVLSLEDVGFGISQILPILVQLAISRHDVLVVEQPELHLHPRLQANFADLLIEAALAETSTQSIVETHSEHLVLRLQRRIRSGKIKPEDVAVYYVDVSENHGSIVTRLEVDIKGDFTSPWPHGFFPERIDEILGS